MNTCDCNVIHQEVVARVAAEMPGETEFRQHSGLFKMFADNTRIKILWALSRDAMCVCDLAVLLDMTKSAISHQLKALRQANLVKCDRRGKVAFHSLADEHVKHILEAGLQHHNCSPRS